MTSPNYDVSELRLLVNAAGWVLGASRLGSATRLLPDTGDPVLTIGEVSSISLAWETTVEETFYILPSISRMTINTPAPEAKDLPTRAAVTLIYRDEELWTGRLRGLSSRSVKRDGQPTIWVTSLNVEGPEQVFEGRTGTLEASEVFDGVSSIMEQAEVGFTRVGSSDASARCLAIHLPPHSQMSQSKLSAVRMFAKQMGSALVGYNYHTGGWELRHAEDAVTVADGMLDASDGSIERLQETGRLHIMPSRGAEEEDPPDFVVFPESDPDPVGQTAGYYAFTGAEQTEVSPLTTTYTFPNHNALLPVRRKDVNAVAELLVPFTEDWLDSGVLFTPLPWRGNVDFADGEGTRDVCILAVTHEISPTGWLMRMQTTDGAILDRFPSEGIAPAIPGEIADIVVSSPGSGQLRVEWEPTARGHVQNSRVLIGVVPGDQGALNPFWAARDISLGGMTTFAIVARSAGTHTFTGLPAGRFSAQIWHLSNPGQSLLHFTDTTVPGVEDSLGRYSIGGHSRTRNAVVS